MSRIQEIRKRWKEITLLNSLEQAKEDIEYLLLQVGDQAATVEPDDVRQVFDEWNKIKGVRHARCLNSARRNQIRIRLRDKHFAAHWREALRNVASSSFCRGDNDRGWQANIDWFLRPTTFAKLIEGYFDGGAKQPDYSTF